MALSIKDPETDRLVRALAEATGESITEAIRRVQERLTGLPVRDPRDPNELLGYDEHGVPR
jgi:antitoxin VapB